MNYPASPSLATRFFRYPIPDIMLSKSVLDVSKFPEVVVEVVKILRL